MEILLFFAFVSGLITIFAPCIWPLLPIILSSSATGDRRKPLGITLGIMLSFGILTLSISYLIKIVPFDPTILRYIAVFVIGFLGLTLVIPKLSSYLEYFVSRLSGKIRYGSQNQKSGFWSGFVVGSALGIVWTPCAGPILATIATLAATTSLNIGIILVTIAYIIGVGIPLFIFATLGKYIFTKSRFLSGYTGRIQQIFGVIMILTAFAIYTNYDKLLQAKLLDAFPAYSNFLYDLEGNDEVQKQLKILKDDEEGGFNLLNKKFDPALPILAEAPEFVGINNWLNTDNPLVVSELKGKVVLVDFWTYTCINCIRTLPYITSWYDKYKDQGLVVVGVHTPEFEFEKNTKNVSSAIEQYKIHYPVAQDNEYSTWDNYNNHYWPAKYLIDANGYIRYVHFGEGKYEETEMAIQALLKEAGSAVSASLEDIPDDSPKERVSPETYLGSKRSEFFYPLKFLSNGIKTFELDENITKNSYSLGGEWEITDEYAKSGKDSVLEYNFYANKVFLVMRPGSGTESKVKVFLDGNLVDELNSGEDAVGGIVNIDSDRLYNLIDLKGNYGDHILRMEFEDSGVEAFAFTFG
jgi:cytochrome c biogenesis protein CcdA/thiol-disulfide isomerase/thioredoxin